MRAVLDPNVYAWAELLKGVEVFVIPYVIPRPSRFRELFGTATATTFRVESGLV